MSFGSVDFVVKCENWNRIRRRRWNTRVPAASAKWNFVTFSTTGWKQRA